MSPITRRGCLQMAKLLLVASPMQSLIARANPSELEATVLRYRNGHGHPRSSQRQDGTWEGFEIDMTNYLLKQVGAKAELSKQFGWARSLRLMRAGELDLLTMVSYREDREPYLDYIGPYDIEELIVLVRQENQHLRFDSLEDFVREGQIIQIVKDAFYSEAFNTRYQQDPSFAQHFVTASKSMSPGSPTANSDSEYGYLENTIRQIHAERITGALIDWYTYHEIMHLVDHNKLDGDIANTLIGIDPNFREQTVTYLCASKTLPQSLRDALRAAYQEARQSGTFARYWTKWYGDRPLPPTA